MSALASLPDSITRQRVLGPEDTATFLGLTVSQVRRMRADWIMPQPIQFSPRRYGWRIGDLIDWLDAGAMDFQSAVIKWEYEEYLREERSMKAIAASVRRSMAA